MNEFFGNIGNDQRGNNAQQVETHHHQTLAVEKSPYFMIRNYQGNQHGVNRQPGAAAHQRCYQIW